MQPTYLKHERIYCVRCRRKSIGLGALPKALEAPGGKQEVPMSSGQKQQVQPRQAAQGQEANPMGHCHVAGMFPCGQLSTLQLQDEEAALSSMGAAIWWAVLHSTLIIVATDVIVVILKSCMLTKDCPRLLTKVALFLLPMCTQPYLGAEEVEKS
jgi:hypothetical protein